MNKIELLAPAGNLEKCKIAILYGADAVYIGGHYFSLRARASNFSLDDIAEACLFAKKNQAKIYVTMNIVPHHEDLSELESYIHFLSTVGVHAVIVSSLYILSVVKKIAPEIEVHMSTQLSISNAKACDYLAKLGVKRVVLAREVDIKQMKVIKNQTKMPLEVFIHGGMCSSYSGRCMLSNHLVNRDANRGGCAHSCRWNYQLYSEANLLHDVDESFNFGAKDLSALAFVPQLIDMEIASLKIEGRMKSDYYIATIVRAYRKAIDAYYQTKAIDFAHIAKEISKAENRQTSIGFLAGDVTINEQLYERDEHPTKTFVGFVLDYDHDTGIAKIEQRNYFAPGDILEFFGPQLENKQIVVKEIWDETWTTLDAARHPKQIVFVETNFVVKKYDMVRVIPSFPC